MTKGPQDLNNLPNFIHFLHARACTYIKVGSIDRAVHVHPINLGHKTVIYR